MVCEVYYGILVTYAVVVYGKSVILNCVCNKKSELARISLIAVCGNYLQSNRVLSLLFKSPYSARIADVTTVKVCSAFFVLVKNVLYTVKCEASVLYTVCISSDDRTVIVAVLHKRLDGVKAANASYALILKVKNSCTEIADNSL